MSPASSEIDRLIEEGLGLYGEGDLDGALLLWERALVIDPDNAQANSYVDYVRMNYELLTSDPDSEQSGPFGIADDGSDYQIEILPGDAVEAAAEPRLSTRDDGSWAIGGDPDAHTRPTREAIGLDERPVFSSNTPTEDLLPPPDEHQAVATFETTTGEGLSFEDATREYPGGAGRPATALLIQGLPAPDIGEFEPAITPPFGSVPADTQTPQDFGAQLTDVRRRDLGFVQPTRDLGPGLMSTRAPSSTSAIEQPPELKMTLRTPSSVMPAVSLPEPAPPDPHRAKTADGESDDEPAVATGSALTLDLASPLDSDPAQAYDSLDLSLPTSTEPEPEPAPIIAVVPAPARATVKLPDDFEPGRFDDDGDEDADEPSEPDEDFEDDLESPDDPLDLLKTLPVPSRSPAGRTRPQPSKARTMSDPRLEDRPTREMPPEARSTPVAAPPPTARTQEIPYTIQLDPRLAIPGDPRVVAATGTTGSAGLGLGAGPFTRDFSVEPATPATPPTGTPVLPSAIAAMIAPAPAPAVTAAGTRTGPLRPASSPMPGLPTRPNDPLISAPTRDLGLRTEKRPATEDEPTAELDVQKMRAQAPPRSATRPVLPGMDPIDARSAEILEEVDRAAPASETREDRTRRRITALLERATEWGRAGDLDRSVTAVDLALSEDPNSALAQKLIHRNRDTIMNAFQGFLGDLQRTPTLARPLHELASAPISPRAAFLLSRVDGTLSLDEILDVSGMPRLEAYRYLCQLFLRGILR